MSTHSKRGSCSACRAKSSDKEKELRKKRSVNKEDWELLKKQRIGKNR